MVTQHSEEQSPSGQLPPGQQWVLLSYRVPREPSTPRIAIWRQLKSHGVAQVGDGLVALPHDARTKEQLEWVAAKALEADGEAIVWVAVTTKRQTADLVAGLNADRDVEYEALLLEMVDAGPGVDGRTISRFRREWRRIERRDHFRSPLRDEVRLAVQALTRAEDAPSSGSSSPTTPKKTSTKTKGKTP